MGREIEKSQKLTQGSVLFDFITRKIREYREPQRKGTPRGDKIGFPWNKHIMSLWVGLTNDKLVTIAKNVGVNIGVSYGLLKKWNSEEDFKLQADRYAQEFVSFIVNGLKSEFRKKLDNYEDYLDGKNEEGLKGAEIVRFKKHAKKFSDRVLIYLEVAAFDFVENKDYLKYRSELNSGIREPDLDQDFNWTMFHQTSNLVKYARGETFKTDSTVNLMLSKSVVSFVESVLTKGEITESERREAVTGLALIREYFEDKLAEKEEQFN